MARGYEREFVPFTAVKLEDRFWAPRLDTNRTVSIPHCFRFCEESGRIANFEKAAGTRKGAHEGLRHVDSDVYKVIEGAAYALSTEEDPELERFVDDLIAKISAAQESDGYLYTSRTIDPHNLPDKAGPQRWSLLEHSHELYDLGHLYEAGVAYFEATGKRSLLEVCIKSAELLLTVFGPNGRRDPPGRQEIEIGLVKLFRATADERYLGLAHFFLEQRGRADVHELYGRRRQDHVPVTEQLEAVGHAVRVGYMCAAMADVAALTPDTGYDNALRRLWQDVTRRKLSLTGGVGARTEGEAFGGEYELPNRTAYNETCAAIGNILWNQRMFLAHGDAAYMDVIETTIYNGFLAGVGLSGDRFFYTNPLESDGKSTFNVGTNDRQAWYSTPCCPTNVVRFVGQMPGLFYALVEGEILINLYAASTTRVEVHGQPVTITQDTDYPWSGSIRVRVDVDQSADLTLSLRIPGWCGSDPVPGGLYEYTETANEVGGASGVGLAINGEAVAIAPKAGYVSVKRNWSSGDEITLELPMAARLVKCDEHVEENRGKVALVRGPIVYCFEETDAGSDPRSQWIGSNDTLTAKWSDELGGIVVVRSPKVTGIPYYAWSHRGPGQMAVWLRQADLSPQARSVE